MAELQMGMSGRLVTMSKSKGRLTTPETSFLWAGLAVTGTVGIIYSFFLPSGDLRFFCEIDNSLLDLVRYFLFCFVLYPEA